MQLGETIFICFVVVWFYSSPLKIKTIINIKLNYHRVKNPKATEEHIHFAKATNTPVYNNTITSDAIFTHQGH